MSGRHTMPPAGRRKAAAESAEATEQVSLDKVAAEQPEPEPTETEPTETEPAETESAAPEDAAQMDEPSAADEPDEPEPSRNRSRIPLVLAALALVLAVACGVLRWLIVTQHESATARTESVEAAKDITVQMLSYETETVDQQLTAARDRMTGEFLGTYTAMINEVIPAAHAQQIAAVADVQRVGVVSAKPDRAEVVMYVDQSVQVGNKMPEKTLSIVRATMVKEGDQWLLSQYEPVQP
ncbi:hypothetical protein [Mycobacterium sp. NS-7484]|uniref:hypothetical protein n=1 Tax=Mycobacterium sp. NS-7484 TaxID=1834161 RepID=UPI00114E7314|nr:hypothetical protein [Mycobacterium sp. NS-7484]